MTIGLIILKAILVYVTIGVLIRFVFTATRGDAHAPSKHISVSIAFILLWPFAFYGLALRFVRYIKRGW